MVSEWGVHSHGGRYSREKSRMASYFLTFTIVVTFILMGLGGFLLYEAVSLPTNSQLLEVIGGAVLVALGLITLYSQGQLAIRRLKEARTHSSRSE